MKNKNNNDPQQSQLTVPVNHYLTEIYVICHMSYVMFETILSYFYCYSSDVKPIRSENNLVLRRCGKGRLRSNGYYLVLPSSDYFPLVQVRYVVLVLISCRYWKSNRVSLFKTRHPYQYPYHQTNIHCIKTLKMFNFDKTGWLDLDINKIFLRQHLFLP